MINNQKPLPMRFFNTASRSIEDFKPIQEGKAALYACGPTVYARAHIGNLRTYVFEDIFRRTLEFAGYDVTHVMNITDVGHLQSDADTGDDKMSIATKREQKSPWDIAKFYEEAFMNDCASIGIHKPHIICRATEYVQEMIDLVKILIEKGHAYESEGNVYFDVLSFPDYTKFAGITLDDEAFSDRVEHDDRKRHQADFALWLSVSKFPNQIMKWDSPWGVGFPGWHIECSAMATKHLGEHFDIHCGGIDHIQVHHTNEIAQSEGAFGHKWVNYWVHGAFLTDETGKMSKSKGDFLSVDLIKSKGFDPLDYRYLLLTTHYRSEIKFTFEALEGAKNSRASLKERIRRLETDQPAKTLGEKAQAFFDQFSDAVRDDLHMPIALTVLWAALKSTDITDAEKLSLALTFDEIFGLDLNKKDERTLTTEQEELLAKRQKAREDKDWAQSDSLRDALLEQGIQVEDSLKGLSWRWL